MSKTIATDVIHGLPDDLRTALLVDQSTLERWEDLTPLARNEWICWIVSVKQVKTRINHIERTIIELHEGKRRPCCWAGCTHRTDKPISATQKWILDRQSRK